MSIVYLKLLEKTWLTIKMADLSSNDQSVKSIFPLPSELKISSEFLDKIYRQLTFSYPDEMEGFDPFLLKLLLETHMYENKYSQSQFINALCQDWDDGRIIERLRNLRRW